jgi:hypothetical protein
MQQYHTTPQSTGLQLDWGTILDQHGVQYLALDLYEDANLFRSFRSDPRWAVYFEDGEGVLLARTDRETDHPSLDSENGAAAHRMPRMDLANDEARAEFAGG